MAKQNIGKEAEANIFKFLEFFYTKKAEANSLDDQKNIIKSEKEFDQDTQMAIQASLKDCIHKELTVKSEEEFEQEIQMAIQASLEDQTNKESKLKTKDSKKKSFSKLLKLGSTKSISTNKTSRKEKPIGLKRKRGKKV